MADDEPILTFSDDEHSIEVRKVKTRNGVRIEIMATESGDAIRVDPIELESLTWQDEDDLAKMFEQTPDSE